MDGGVGFSSGERGFRSQLWDRRKEEGRILVCGEREVGVLDTFKGLSEREGEREWNSKNCGEFLRVRFDRGWW